MKVITYLLIVLIAITAFTSCKKDYVVGQTNATTVANGWWVLVTQGGADVGFGEQFFATYNTSANSDSIWLDDLGNGLGFKCKVPVNFSTMTFSADSALSSENGEHFDIFGDSTSYVTVIGGKVLSKA